MHRVSAILIITIMMLSASCGTKKEHIIKHKSPYKAIVFQDTIVEWIDEDITDSLSEVLIKQFYAEECIELDRVLYAEFKKNRFIGIMEHFYRYMPEKDSCILHQQSYHYREVEYLLWTKTDDSGKKKAVHFLCIPDAWDILF